MIDEDGWKGDYTLLSSIFQGSRKRRQRRECVVRCRWKKSRKAEPEWGACLDWSSSPPGRAVCSTQPHCPSFMWGEKKEKIGKTKKVTSNVKSKSRTNFQRLFKIHVSLVVIIVHSHHVVIAHKGRSGHFVFTHLICANNTSFVSAQRCKFLERMGHFSFSKWEISNLQFAQSGWHSCRIFREDSNNKTVCVINTMVSYHFYFSRWLEVFTTWNQWAVWNPMRHLKFSVSCQILFKNNTGTAINYFSSCIVIWNLTASWILLFRFSNPCK